MASAANTTRPESANPGESKVDSPKPFQRLKHETIQGKSIELRPWEDSFAEKLFPHFGGPENVQLFAHTGIGPFDDIEALQTSLSKMTSDKVNLWGIFKGDDNPRDECVGLAMLHTSDEQDRRIESGLLLGRAAQKTVVGTEALYLIAGKAFGLGCRRFEWKCDNENVASRNAGLRFGFRKFALFLRNTYLSQDSKDLFLFPFVDVRVELEGILRQHVIIKDKNRDSAWFSMLDKEWPDRKLAVEGWLDDDNFDADGRQKKNLAAFMKTLAGNNS